MKKRYCILYMATLHATCVICFFLLSVSKVNLCQSPRRAPQGHILRTQLVTVVFLRNKLGYKSPLLVRKANQVQIILKVQIIRLCFGKCGFFMKLWATSRISQKFRDFSAKLLSFFVKSWWQTEFPKVQGLFSVWTTVTIFAQLKGLFVK